MEPRHVHVPARLNTESLTRFVDELDSAHADRQVSVIVLVGSKEIFCAGLDTDALLAESDREVRRRSIEGYQRCLLRTRFGSKPTIAVVEAQAQGGGVGIALASDFVLATEKASFALPEALFGLMPAMVMPFALERMSPQKARLWALSARGHGPEEALAAGVVDRVVEGSSLESALRRVVRELGRTRPLAVESLKAFSGRAGRLSLESALIEGGELTLEMSFDPAVANALETFREFGVIDWSEETFS